MDGASEDDESAGVRSTIPIAMTDSNDVYLRPPKVEIHCFLSPPPSLTSTVSYPSTHPSTHPSNPCNRPICTYTCTCHVLRCMNHFNNPSSLPSSVHACLPSCSVHAMKGCPAHVYHSPTHQLFITTCTPQQQQDSLSPPPASYLPHSLSISHPVLT